jgi:hypothetical protein
MSDCDDLYERARKRPQSLRLKEAIQLAECWGFVLARQTGSHRIYKRKGYIHPVNLQPLKNGMAKPFQVRQILAAIEDLKGRGET